MIAFGLVVRSSCASEPLVRSGLVFAGLISAIPRLLERGISALATLLLKGPTTPSTELSLAND